MNQQSSTTCATTCDADTDATWAAKLGLQTCSGPNTLNLNEMYGAAKVADEHRAVRGNGGLGPHGVPIGRVRAIWCKAPSLLTGTRVKSGDRLAV